MVSPDWKRLRPVTKAVVCWVGVGLALVLAGLYDLATYSCHPSGDTGCGGPFGFVLLLWGAPILALSALFVLIRLHAEPAREGPAD